jgi:hypothetical protein
VWLCGSIRSFVLHVVLCGVACRHDRLRPTDETIQGIMDNSRLNLRKSIYVGNREMNFPQVKIWPVIM